jgi:type IV secretory pathway VirB2 component (pilin)
MREEYIPPQIIIPRSNVASVFTHNFVVTLQLLAIVVFGVALLAGYSGLSRQSHQIQLAERV